MSFTVKLYSFSKKENSTAVPAAAALVRELQALIKQPSGIMEPVMRFQIDTPPYPAAQNCNYAYIEEFNRYYFITDWTSEPGKIWTASMRVDPLASWKSYIGSQSFYVLRSSAEKDGDIMDAMYPAKDTYSIAIQSNLATPSAWWNLDTDRPPLDILDPESWAEWVDALSTGFFILGVLSYCGSPDVVGGVNYIAMYPSQFYAFMNIVFNDTASETVLHPTGNLPEVYGKMTQKVLENAGYQASDFQNLAYTAENPYTDYVKSVVWVPDAPIIGDIKFGLHFGIHVLDCSYFNVQVKDHVHKVATFNCPKHRLTNSRGSYVNCEPFTEVYARLPKMGNVKIPADLIAAYNYCFITLDIDPITGEGRYSLRVSNENSLIGAFEVNRWYAQLGVQIQIAQTNDVGARSIAEAKTAGAILGLVTNPGSITQLPAAIAEAKKAREANGNTIGAAGGWLGLSGNEGTPYIIGIHYDIADDDNTHNGRPLCKVRTPASLGGYMMIQDADISAPATKQELEEIRGYMEGGFYYE